MASTPPPGYPGPWRFTDPAGEIYHVTQVPLEFDRHLPPGPQPQALVFQTERGWISTVPVGPDFRFDRLTDQERLFLLEFASSPTA